MRAHSEFACEVVMIAEVLPHPNADRLDVLKFFMAADDGTPTLTGYTCVGQRGGFKRGDLAVYCSVDAVVPLARPEFEFLSKRPDGAGKNQFRLRAARLRGVYSEGLLVPAPVGAKCGDDLADAWGVTQHLPPQPHVPGMPTPKTRVPHWLEALVPQYGVVSLRKVPGLFADGEPVIVTEKIHGTNFRFGWVRRRWMVGSHRTIKTEYRSLWQRLTDWLRGKRRRGGTPGWHGTVSDGKDLYTWTADHLGLREKCRLAPGVVFYGEIFGRTPTGAGIQDMVYGQSMPAVRLFDAYDTTSHTWYTRSELERVAADLELPELVPEVARGPFDFEMIKGFAEGVSQLDEHTIMEGVVVEDIHGGKKGKYVSEAYRMRKELAP